MTAGSALSGAIRELADLTDIRGAAVAAADLRRAATAIDALDRDAAASLVGRARRGRVGTEPGVSPTTHWCLHEIARGGAHEMLRAARAGLPQLIRRLLELPALEPAGALALVRQLGVATLPDLHLALDDRRVYSTFGPAAEERLTQAARALEGDVRPLPLGRAWDLLDDVAAAVAKSGALLDSLEPGGDVRRFEPLVYGLVLVGSAPNPPAVIDAICALPGFDDVVHRSNRRALLVRQGIEIDVRVAAPDEHGTVLVTTTGSRPHLSALKRRRSRSVLARTEEDIYAAAGLPWIAPELRHATGEVESASAGRLPRLVTRGDIRGDLHMHTTYSDGRDSLDVMVAECSRLGYEYIAITDHSEGATASRTLARGEIRRQRDEIRRIQARFPHMRIFHGVEVDILPDGRLDFDDDVLERFDLVLASLHESARQDGPTLTARYLRAIAHPLVTIITHPSNRLVGRKSGYQLDYDAIYAAAAGNGTALEVDGGPAHLDLDGDQARAAIAAGVTLTIDSDCHRARSLDRQMRLGIGTARRGWVEPRHVLNTRSADDVLAFARAKRTRR